LNCLETAQYKRHGGLREEKGKHWNKPPRKRRTQNHLAFPFPSNAAISFPKVAEQSRLEKEWKREGGLKKREHEEKQKVNFKRTPILYTRERHPFH